VSGAPAAADIDALAARAMEGFSVPGMAIAVVKDGATVFARGYGMRAAGKPERVDENTLFAIGSNTKAFTAAALAMLVDEGALTWDDKVIDHLPGFRLHDPYVTRELTVRDLLTHRSGLGLGAGDLMIFPHTDFTREEIVRNLRFLKPASSFRSAYAYDNLLYIVAGQVVAAAAGETWEAFVQARILDRLHMDCAVDLAHLPAGPNIAAPHVLIDGSLREIAPDINTGPGPAGSIWCGARGMAVWMALQLAGGAAADGARLFSEARGKEMWTPQTVIAELPPTAAMTRTHLRAYGLGWMVEDYLGALRVWHTGGLIGMVSYVSLVPEKGLGVVVLTNQQSPGGMASVMHSLLDAHLGAPPRDWVEWWIEEEARTAAKQAAAVSAAEGRARKAGGRAAMPLDAYVGVYRDPWRGDAAVTREGGALRLTFSRTSAMAGALVAQGGNVFLARWDDRTLNADALVNFGANFEGAICAMTMKAVSPTTDFSFDFHDLDFTRVEPVVTPLPVGEGI